MKIIHSTTVPTAEPNPEIGALLATTTESQLRQWVEPLAKPRHFLAEPEQNRATAEWLASKSDSWGFQVERQCESENVVASPRVRLDHALVVGAHYDSVPECPGADDNGSAVAAMLGCAQACAQWNPSLPAVFVAFNRE